MERTYNTEKAAELLGITRRTLRQWIKDGKIKAYKYTNQPNGHWYIYESEIARIKEQANGSV